MTLYVHWLIQLKCDWSHLLNYKTNSNISQCKICWEFSIVSDLVLLLLPKRYRVTKWYVLNQNCQIPIDIYIINHCQNYCHYMDIYYDNVVE